MYRALMLLTICIASPSFLLAAEKPEHRALAEYYAPVVYQESKSAILDYITRFVDELQVGTVNVWEVPGYRIEMSPFGGIKDSGLGYKEGVLEAMKSFTNVKTWSLPWPG